MATPDRTMATTTGTGAGAGAAAATTAAMISGCLSFIVGLLFGMSKGELAGFWKGKM
jgi:hypothetical protein